MRLALVGVAAGAVAAAALTRVLSGMLFGVRPMDPATYVIVGGDPSGIARGFSTGFSEALVSLVLSSVEGRA